MPEVFRTSEVAWVRRIHVRRLRRWDKEGRLQPMAGSGGGHRRYVRGDALALLDEGDTEGNRAAAVYTRVRTGKQAEAGNLERPPLRLMEHAVRKGIAWCCTWVTWHRAGTRRPRGLHRVVEAARRRGMRFLLVEYPDRLAVGLSVPYLETRFDVLSVRSVVTADQEPEGVPAELVKDSLGIVTSFSGKWYELRGGRRARAQR